jgi:hypothetical protein
MNPFPADDARLRALILHISLRCGDWPGFDMALLDRLLFQADFLHFRLYGFPITGQTYVRSLRSPAPQVLRGMVRRMIQSGDFAIREVEVGDGLHVRNIPAAHREPDLRIFDGQEIAVVERVLWFYRQHWAGETAGPDLLEIPWELADLWEEIPYALALISGARSDEPPQAMRLPRPEARPQEQENPHEEETAGLAHADPLRIPAPAYRITEINRLTAAD